MCRKSAADSTAAIATDSWYCISMRYFSTFTGIGGFEYGIERAFGDKQVATVEQDREGRDGPAYQTGVDVHHRSDPPLCVGFSEIDGPAIKTYEEHYEHKNYGDITAIDSGDLPDFDLIVGGFPCQAFSIAGRRGGFDDTRGTLFFDVARILRDKRPGHLVLENVKGLLSHDGGKTFTTILGVLSDLGYRVEWQVLNSKNFGVPQNRERIYIVGHLGNDCAGKVFPLGEGGRRYHAAPDGTSGEGERLRGDDTRVVAATLAVRDYKGGNNLIKQLNQPTHSNDRVYSAEGIGPTLNTMQGGRRQPFVAQESARIRRLTPVECERLQGFPDNWTVGSDTQRYKQCGNAVTTNVVAAVIGNMSCLL